MMLQLQGGKVNNVPAVGGRLTIIMQLQGGQINNVPSIGVIWVGRLTMCLAWLLVRLGG